LQGKSLEKATVRAFKDSQKSFARFLIASNSEDCLPKDADKGLIENYRLFMLRDLGNKESSVANRLRHLHQVIRKAMQERYIHEDPFELIDIETPTYERNALTSDDLHKLLSYRPHRSVENYCRLIFLLGCFTGLAFSDLKKLRMDDIYTLSDGCRYISLCRTKTQNRSIVPLLPIAEEILSFVSDGRKEGLFFREFPTNSHFNLKIREIIIKAGLPPHTEATSHTARHTFATTICLENGLPIETVSKMLGHRFISTTELYAKVSKSKIAREMQPLMGSDTTRELRKALRVCPPRKKQTSSLNAN
jgi:putative integrase